MASGLDIACAIKSAGMDVAQLTSGNRTLDDHDKGTRATLHVSPDRLAVLGSATLGHQGWEHVGEAGALDEIEQIAPDFAQVVEEIPGVGNVQLAK